MSYVGRATVGPRGDAESVRANKLTRLPLLAWKKRSLRRVRLAPRTSLPKAVLHLHAELDRVPSKPCGAWLSRTSELSIPKALFCERRFSATVHSAMPQQPSLRRPR